MGCNFLREQMLNSSRLIIILLALGLAACGSTTNKTSKPRTVSQVEVEEVAELKEDPQYYLTQAQREFSSSGDENVRNIWIMRAVEAYKQQGDCDKSQTILSLSLPEITNETLRDQAKLVIAECLVNQPVVNYQSLETLLDQIQQPERFTDRYLTLKTGLLVYQKRWIDAAKMRLKSNSDAHTTALDIWYLLQNLSEKELEKARLSEPQLQAWLQLSLIVQRYGLDSAKLQTEVNGWQQRNSNHPLRVELPVEVTTAIALTPFLAKRTAILLPLSGRLAQQGQAIKDGVLAGYFTLQNQDTQIQFFDTVVNDAKTLAELTNDFDVVIGPLMKDELAEYIKYASYSTNILGLNRVDTELPSLELETPSLESGISETLEEVIEPSQSGLRLFFALSPEDEAAQLAEKVFLTGALHPIVVSQESGASRRMAEEFLLTWQYLAGQNSKSPSFATFANNAAMRESISSLLDVAQSDSRIKEIEYMTSEQVHSVPRNRRDIDSIIVFASPEQTELLNPIIEASLSPFNDKVVPVFASSRSYSLNFSNNSLRDLRNLTFTEMPWMLPSNRWQAIAEEVNTLWPEQNDTLRRLFALGFDAYKLTFVLNNLQALPQLSMPGMTGNLAIDKQGNVVRVMSLGHITENKVTLFALD